MTGVKILLDQFAKISASFRHHRILQIRTELGIELLIGIVGGNLPQPQPLPEKVLDEPLRLGIAQQPLHFRPQSFRLTQLAGGCQFNQPLVGSGSPEEVGESAGKAEAVELTWRLDMIEKIW